MHEIKCYDSIGNSIHHLTQWDVNQTVYFPEWEYTNGSTVFHFCNKKSTKVIPVRGNLVEGTMQVKIPNELLQSTYTIFGYAYLYENNGELDENEEYSARTVLTVHIPIRDRLKPADYDEHYEDNIDVAEEVALIDARIDNLIVNLLNADSDTLSFAEVVDARLSSDGTTYSTLKAHLDAIENDITTAIEELINGDDLVHIDGLIYDEAESMLYLAYQDEPVSEGVMIVSGGGSGGDGGTVLKVKNKNKNASFPITSDDEEVTNSFTCSIDSTIDLYFDISVTEKTGDDYVPTSDKVTVQYYIDGVLKATEQNVSQGLHSFRISNYLGAGQGQQIRVKVTDPNLNVKNISYTATVVELAITSTFDAGQIYSNTDDIDFKYTPYGGVPKTIHFYIDGSDVGSIENVTASGKQGSKVLDTSSLSHGSHTLRVYATATMDGMNMTSNELVYDFIVAVSGNTTPIIASNFSQTTATEGDTIEIPWLVYTPSASLSDVTLKIYGKENDSWVQYWSNSLTNIPRTNQVWKTKNYPTGDVKFEIASGGVSKSFEMTIAELEVDIELLDTYNSRLSAAGKSNSDVNRNQWVEEKSGNNVITMNQFNYITNGWIDGALEVSGSATAVINTPFFSQDFKNNGKTIEIEFETKRVKDTDAVVLSCMNGGIGIEVTPQEFTFNSELSSVSAKFKEEERIRMSIVIEPASNDANANRLIHLYINGIDSGCVQYPAIDNFEQSTPVGITVGSVDCTTRVYSIVDYNVALTRRQILNNYIAERDDVEEKLALYQRNNIYYNDNDKIIYNTLNEQIPCMIITGTLPTYKGDKKTVDITYSDLNDSTNNFDWSAVQIDVQGTSSQYYPIKNFKIKIKSNAAYQLSSDVLPAKTFCLKADFAESSGTHNTGFAKYIDNKYAVNTPPQEDDSTIRTTIYGFPICVFHRETANDDVEFVGKYNFNTDKGAENTFGFDSTEYPNCECWEVKNNTSARCLFKSDDFTEMDYEGDTPKLAVLNDFEARFPDGYEEDNPSHCYDNLQALSTWIVSTDTTQATGDALDNSVTYNGTTYTNDTAAYRLAKFKAEFTQHFNMEFALIYYIFTELLAMVDSRAKNMMIATWDGTIWYVIFYDMDTILGINNEGGIAFRYNVEYHDVIGSQAVYNGNTSVLWNNFESAFASEIKSKYQSLRTNGLITPANILAAFNTEQSDKWCEAVYNEDGYYKYISPMVNGYWDSEKEEISHKPFMQNLQGSRESHRTWWLSNRINYMDSKYQAHGYLTDYATMRLYTPTEYTGVLPNASFSITPYSDMYVAVKFGSYVRSARGTHNEVTTITAPNIVFNDTETIVYGAGGIASLGDLSDKYIGSLDISSAKRLSEIRVGSSVRGYQNTNFNELKVGNNPLLRKIDIQNCPNLKSALTLYEKDNRGNVVVSCENISEIYAKGSGITSVVLPDSGYLTVMQLPETITNLTVKNQSYLTNFSIDGVDKLTSLCVEGTPTIPTSDIVAYANSINRVRLIDINWTLQNSRALRHLVGIPAGYDAQGRNVNYPVCTGTVTVATEEDSELSATLEELFPELTVTWGSTAEKVVEFVDGDGNVIDTDYVASGSDATDPATRAMSPIIPTKTPTARVSYVFDEWDTPLTNITVDTTITATFDEISVPCTATFIDTYRRQTEQDYEPYQVSISAGGTISYLFDVTQKYTDSNNVEHVFVGWESSDTDIATSAMGNNGKEQFTVIDDSGDVVFTTVYKSVVVPEDLDDMVNTYGFGSPLLEALDWAELRAIMHDTDNLIYDSGTFYYDFTNSGGTTQRLPLFSTFDTKTINLSNGGTQVIEVAAYQKDVEYQHNSNKIPLSFTFKYLRGNQQFNSGNRYLYNYSIGEENYKAYELSDMATSAYTPTTADITAGYAEIEFKDYSVLSKIEVKSGDTVDTTWYFDSTQNATNSMMSNISGWSVPVSAGTARFPTTQTYSLANLVLDGRNGAILFNYNNVGNATTTGMSEFQNGAKIKVPVTQGQTVVVYNYACSNNGGYMNSTYRNYVLNSLYPMFPYEVKNCLGTPSVKCNLGAYSKTIVELNDPLFPLSPTQVGQASSDAYLVAQGLQYDIFTDNTSRIRKSSATATSGSYWWLRTTSIADNRTAWRVQSDGSTASWNNGGGDYNANVRYGVLLGLTI